MTIINMVGGIPLELDDIGNTIRISNPFETQGTAMYTIYSTETTHLHPTAIVVNEEGTVITENFQILKWDDYGKIKSIELSDVGNAMPISGYKTNDGYYISTYDLSSNAWSSAYTGTDPAFPEGTMYVISNEKVVRYDESESQWYIATKTDSWEDVATTGDAPTLTATKCRVIGNSHIMAWCYVDTTYANNICNYLDIDTGAWVKVSGNYNSSVYINDDGIYICRTGGYVTLNNQPLITLPGFTGGQYPILIAVDNGKYLYSRATLSGASVNAELHCTDASTMTTVGLNIGSSSTLTSRVMISWGKTIAPLVPRTVGSSRDIMILALCGVGEHDANTRDVIMNEYSILMPITPDLNI